VPVPAHALEGGERAVEVLGGNAPPKRRETLLHQIQRLAHERVMHAPLWELGFLNAVGPRVEESGIGLIALHPYSSPYEDLKLKK